MMRSEVEHHIGSIDGIDKRDSIDLLAHFDVIVSIEKMAAIQGHDVLRQKSAAIQGEQDAAGQGAAMPDAMAVPRRGALPLPTNVPDAQARIEPRIGRPHRLRPGSGPRTLPQ
jgi:hypothetical protein